MTAICYRFCYYLQMSNKLSVIVVVIINSYFEILDKDTGAHLSQETRLDEDADRFKYPLVVKLPILPSRHPFLLLLTSTNQLTTRARAHTTVTVLFHM